MSDASDSISFNYTIKEEDYVRAIRAHTLTVKWVWGVWIVFGVLVVYGVLQSLFFVVVGHQTWLDFGQDVLVLAVCTAAIWGSYWFPPRWAMRGSPSIGVEEEVILLEDRIVVQSRLGREELMWAHFKKVDETGDFFLMHPHEGNFYPFPKQYFANSVELDRFRKRIRKNILKFHEH